MRYFIDTEFLEDGKTIELISIGIVAEDGREFYAENLDFDLSSASEWLKENVLPHLWRLNENNRTQGNAWSRDGGIGGLMRLQEIASEVRRFCSRDTHGKPEFWGYYADYDWVVFCQLFGRMIDLPEGWPMYCRDLKQLSDAKGIDRLPQPTGTEHHALADARWNRDSWKFLSSLTPTPGDLRAKFEEWYAEEWDLIPTYINSRRTAEGYSSLQINNRWEIFKSVHTYRDPEVEALKKEVESAQELRKVLEEIREENEARPHNDNRVLLATVVDIPDAMELEEGESYAVIIAPLFRKWLEENPNARP